VPISGGPDITEGVINNSDDLDLELDDLNLNDVNVDDGNVIYISCGFAKIYVILLFRISMWMIGAKHRMLKMHEGYLGGVFFVNIIVMNFGNLLKFQNFDFVYSVKQFLCYVL
jgi:hypothetical protein